MKKNRKWKHPKQKSVFTSSYQMSNRDRVFQLTNGKRTISFESWQDAVLKGWEKVND